MSAHVLLNLLNKLKIDQIRGLASIVFFSIFRNSFNKFNNSGARIYSYYPKKASTICHTCTRRCYRGHFKRYHFLNHLWFIDFNR